VSIVGAVVVDERRRELHGRLPQRVGGEPAGVGGDPLVQPPHEVDHGGVRAGLRRFLRLVRRPGPVGMSETGAVADPAARGRDDGVPGIVATVRGFDTGTGEQPVRFEVVAEQTQDRRSRRLGSLRATGDSEPHGFTHWSSVRWFVRLPVPEPHAAAPAVGGRASAPG
jgi:hypothetical protein